MKHPQHVMSVRQSFKLQKLLGSRGFKGKYNCVICVAMEGDVVPSDSMAKRMHISGKEIQA